MQLLDMRPDHIELVQRILRQHVPSAEVLAFGSRAKWLARDTSDLDLCIRATAALSFEKMGTLREAFEESNLPYKVDVVDWATTSESFRKIIERDKVVVQKTTSHQCRLGGVGLADERAKVPLGNVITLQRGFDLPSQNRKPGKVPIVSSSGVCDYHSEVGVKGPGVVTGRYGTIGQVFLIKEDFWPLNTTLWVKDFHGNDPHFTSYLLRTIDFRSCSDKSSVPGVNRNDLHRIPVLRPPLPVQRAIAHILGTLDDKIELNRRMNATLEAMARALFQSWFVDFDPVRAKLDGRPPAALDPATTALFPDSFEESSLGHIPKGWEVGKIQDCCVQIQNGGTPRRNEPRFWDGGNIPWLASGEVRQSIITATESFITEEGLAESSAKWVPVFSTVVALYGATAGQVSFTACRLTTNQAVCALIPTTGFAFFNYLTMRGATAEMENKAVGSAQQNISKGIVEETLVVLPPTALVERFAEVASPLFERWISNLHQSRTLATLRDALLPKLLSGELSVAELKNLTQDHD